MKQDRLAVAREANGLWAAKNSTQNHSRRPANDKVLVVVQRIAQAGKESRDRFFTTS